MQPVWFPGPTLHTIYANFLRSTLVSPLIQLFVAREPHFPIWQLLNKRHKSFSVPAHQYIAVHFSATPRKPLERNVEVPMIRLDRSALSGEGSEVTWSNASWRCWGLLPHATYLFKRAWFTSIRNAQLVASRDWILLEDVCTFSFVMYRAVYLETMRWADPLSKGPYQMQKGFVSELILNRDNTQELIRESRLLLKSVFFWDMTPCSP
jgi:hypothetical protein